MQRRRDALQLSGCAFAGEDVAAEGFENLDGDGLLDAADVGFGLIGPDDAVCAIGLRFAAHLLPVGHGEAELGEHLLMGDRLVVLAPFVGLGDRLGFGGAEGVAILFRRDHGFEQVNHGGELAGPELVQQIMGVLYISGHCVLP